MVAIAIPLFKAQRDKAIDATNKANIRAAYAAAANAFYDSGMESTQISGKLHCVYYEYDTKTGMITKLNITNHAVGNSLPKQVCEDAKKHNIIDKVYVYIGESDKPGKPDGFSIETAPHFHGDKVAQYSDSNPYGWYSAEDD